MHINKRWGFVAGIECERQEGNLPDGQQALLYCLRQVMPAGQQAEKGATVGPQVDLSRGLSHDPLIRTAQPETGSCACARNMRD